MVAEEPLRPSPWVAASVFAVVLAVYTATLMPTVPGGDSGELVAEACELGTAHPPGYPLYTLVVHLLTYIPFGTMAWRANEFCAVLGSLAAALITRAVGFIISEPALVTKRVASQPRSVLSSSAALAGLLYAFSPLVWTYSVGSEVFAMNNFFAALLVCLTTEYAVARTETARIHFVKLGAFVCGLGMCNQHTLILYEIPLISWILFTFRSRITPGRFSAWASLFFLGLAPYAYLFVSSAYFPKKGAWGDTSSLMGFWRHLRRADYGTFRLYSRDDDTQGLTERLYAHMNDFTTRQALYVGPVLAAGAVAQCGMALLRSRASTRAGRARATKHATPPAATSTAQANDDQLPVLPVTGALVGAFVFYEIGFHSLSNLPLENPLLFGVHARFWMQPNILLCAFAGVGTASLAGLMFSAPQGGTFAGPVTVGISLALVAAQLYRWHDAMDQHENRFLDQYARAVFASIPPDSLFFTNYDQQWTSTRYLHVCEGLRKDLPFMNLSMMTFWWFHRQRSLFKKVAWPRLYMAGPHTAQYKRGEAFSFKELLDANHNRFPGGIYLGGLAGDSGGGYEEAYESVPVGLLSRMEPRNAPRDPEYFARWLAESNRVWERIDEEELPELPSLNKYTPETWEWTVGKDYWDNRGKRASFMLDMVTNPKTCGSLCTNRTRELEVLILAANEFERVIAGDPDSQGGGSHIWKNAGIAYSRIIQGKFPPEVMSAYERPDAYPFLPHVREKMVGEGRVGGWTEHASYRTLQTWKQFTVMPGAEQDASFATIKNVVAYLSETDERSSAGQAGGVSGQTTADNDAPKRSSRRQKTVKKSRRKKRKRKSKSRKNRQNK